MEEYAFVAGSESQTRGNSCTPTEMCAHPVPPLAMTWTNWNKPHSARRGQRTYRCKGAPSRPCQCCTWKTAAGASGSLVRSREPDLLRERFQCGWILALLQRLCWPKPLLAPRFDELRCSSTTARSSRPDYWKGLLSSYPKNIGERPLPDSWFQFRLAELLNAPTISQSHVRKSQKTKLNALKPLLFARPAGILCQRRRVRRRNERTKNSAAR